jgi:hypothetical protein
MAIGMSERVTDVGKFKRLPWSCDGKAGQRRGLKLIACTELTSYGGAGARLDD